MAEKLESDQGAKAREVWTEKGKKAFEEDQVEGKHVKR
jgi:hypothetical protein